MVTHRSSSPVPLYASLLMRRTVFAEAVVGLEWLLDRRSLRNAPQPSLRGSIADADGAQWIELLRSVEIASTVSR